MRPSPVGLDSAWLARWKRTSPPTSAFSSSLRASSSVIWICGSSIWSSFSTMVLTAYTSIVPVSESSAPRRFSCDFKFLRVATAIASSTAPITICGSMFFSRLNASICCCKRLAIKKVSSFQFPVSSFKFCASIARNTKLATSNFLNFRHQIRLVHIRQVDLQLVRRRRRFVLFLRRSHVHRQLTVGETLQPSLKVAIVLHRFARRQLYQAANEALIIRRLGQRPIQPWRRNLQRIWPRSRRLLNVEDGAHFPADVGAILMGDA